MSVIGVMMRPALPVLLTVMVCVALDVPTFCTPKESDVGLKLITGAAGDTPVPVSEAVCGLLAALSAMLTLAEAAPATVGENFTVTWHVPPLAGTVVHLLLCVNSEAFVPVMLIEETVNGTVELLVTVMTWPALVVLSV